LTNFLKILKHQTWLRLTSRSRDFPSGQTDREPDRRTERRKNGHAWRK